MHHVIFPSQDTFLTNRQDFVNKNLGLDEMLRVGTNNIETKTTVATKDFLYNNVFVTNFHVDNFTGTILSGSLAGTSSFISGTLVFSGSTEFTTSYFSGSFTGSYNGFSTGSFVSSSAHTGSINGFSGSIVSSNIVGIISGSTLEHSGKFLIFNGIVTGSKGAILSGSILGIDTKNQQNVVTSTTKFLNRSLVQFNISEISTSIANGSIPSPSFTLKLDVARENNLPLTYSIYALPISQSWNKGTGVFFDAGSDKGASWNYRDYYGGTRWYNATSSNTGVIDFINHPERSTESFSRGGGNWYTSSLYLCSQSFDNETSDIVMDVNRIVYGWISQSISNNGFLLLTSDELETTGSEMGLYFFSRDTNTIYTPRLDVGWNDVSFITGSTFTGSVQSYVASGSILSFFTGGNVLFLSLSASFTGSFTGSAYVNGTSFSGSVMITGSDGVLSGSIVDGRVTGSIFTQSIEGNFLSGKLAGRYFTGSTDGTGSFNVVATGSYLLSGSRLSGSTNPSNQVNAILSGSIFDSSVAGIYNNGQFSGILEGGILPGAFITGSLTGSYATSLPTTISIIASSSLEAIEFNVPFTIVLQNIDHTVKSNNIIRVNVFARDSFPLKNFNRQTQLTQYLTPKYLPTSSYYSIKDNETEKTFIDFDNNTKLSCDTNGNYFLLDTSGLPQERYFKILIKTEQSGSIFTFDNGNIFKIVR